MISEAGARLRSGEQELDDGQDAHVRLEARQRQTGSVTLWTRVQCTRLCDVTPVSGAGRDEDEETQTALSLTSGAIRSVYRFTPTGLWLDGGQLNWVAWLRFTLSAVLLTSPRWKRCHDP